MACDGIPRVRTWEELTALGLEACDLVLVDGTHDPIPAFLAERRLPPPPATPTQSARAPAQRR
jgi:hypothetical protein